MSLLLSTLAAIAAPSPDGVAAFVRRDLRIARYRTASFDLNGDGSPETLVYAQGPGACGSGGCDLYVLTRRRGRLEVVTRLSVVRTPVRVLATASHGWRDLGVQVAGGGIVRGHVARLRFDGRSYPANPTVAPATPMARPAGRILLD